MTQFTPISAVVGGAMIGLAAVMLYRLNGRIAGVSGIVHGLFTRGQSENIWRVLFVVGIIAGGLMYRFISGEPLSADFDAPLGIFALAGVIVGIGTRLGSGCTSGHGVCGIARFSIRSLVATVTFLVFGIVTATVVHGFLLQ